MSISVVIPTHNRCELLPRALNSVLSQTSPPMEIIVVDDGSTDDTARMIGKNYPQVHLVSQSHAGVSAARNTGIRQARGDWIAFLDSDDEWAASKLQRQEMALQDHPEFAVCHTNEKWIRDGLYVNQKRKHQKYGGQIYRRCLPLCAISPSTVILHRVVFDQIGLFNETLPVCEDYDLWLRVTCRYPVLFIDEPLITKYGGHSDQLSQEFWGMDRFRIRALHEILRRGELSAEDAEETRLEICKKLRVFIKGADKRQRSAGVESYRTLLEHWQTSAQGLESRDRTTGPIDSAQECR